MKKLSIFQKLIYLITVIMALLLLLACIIPYFPVKLMPLFSFISLAVPALVVVNILLVIYWIFARFKKSLFPILALFVGYIWMGSFVQFRQAETTSSDSELRVMTYNSYSFKGRTKGKEQERENGINIIKFITEQNPDIVCFQEFDYKRIKSGELDSFPYSYTNFVFGAYRKKIVQAIYSKYPIVSSGDLDFPESYNNAIYADVLYRKDTLRVYNIHLESLGITSARKALNKPAEKLYEQLGSKFRKQEEQALLVSAHAKTTTHKKITCGDFNNGQYSRIQNLIRGDMQDSFEEKGSGYGRTYNYHGLPVRIDFILADEGLKVKSHKNFNVKYSDHFPVMASFSLD